MGILAAGRILISTGTNFANVGIKWTVGLIEVIFCAGVGERISDEVVEIVVPHGVGREHRIISIGS